MGSSSSTAKAKRLEQQIQDPLERAAAAKSIAERSELARQIAHEVNNPLAIIAGRANQLKRLAKGTENENELRPVVDSIIDTIRRAAEAVSILLVLFDADSIRESKMDGNDSESRKLNSAFFHDCANILAIAHGKARQAEKFLKSKDLSSGAVAKAIEKNTQTIQALDKLADWLKEQSQVQQTRKKPQVGE